MLFTKSTETHNWLFKGKGQENVNVNKKKAWLKRSIFASVLTIRHVFLCKRINLNVKWNNWVYYIYPWLWIIRIFLFFVTSAVLTVIRNWLHLWNNFNFSLSLINDWRRNTIFGNVTELRKKNSFVRVEGRMKQKAMLRHSIFENRTHFFDESLSWAYTVQNCIMLEKWLCVWWLVC